MHTGWACFEKYNYDSIDLKQYENKHYIFMADTANWI